MDHTSSSPLVLVIGGGGYIGSILTRLLLAEGYRVRVYDNFLFGTHGLSTIEDQNLEVVIGDICDTKSLSYALTGAEIVIHMAAIVGRRIKDIRRASSRDVNLLAASVVVDAAVEHGAERFIFASTDSVYGVQSGIMYETTTPEPISLYSRLKLRMEERVMNAKNRYFHTTVLRVTTCYGYSPRMRFDLVANSLVRDAVSKGVVHIQNGEQVRPLIHVADAAQAFYAVAKAHVNLISGEIFNVGPSSDAIQIIALANTVKSLVPAVEIAIEDGEVDLKDYRLSCTKIEKAVDFTPTHTIEPSLTELRDMLTEAKFGDPYSLKYSNT